MTPVSTFYMYSSLIKSLQLSPFSVVIDKGHLNLHSRKYKHNRMCYVLYDLRYGISFLVVVYSG